MSNPQAVPPEIRIVGPLGSLRTVIINGMEIPGVRFVRVSEEIGNYQVVTIEIITNNAVVGAQKEDQ